MTTWRIASLGGMACDFGVRAAKTGVVTRMPQSAAEIVRRKIVIIPSFPNMT